MSTFRYEARDSGGELITGHLEAENVQAAIAELHSRGTVVQSIALDDSARSAPPADRLAASARANGITGDVPRRFAGESVERGVLRTHVATILERGRAIAPALAAYAEEMPAGWQRRELLAVCGILERGDANEAAVALSELPEYWIPLLSAATSSADPGHVLHEFLTESRYNDELRQKWWLTLAYPIFVMGLALVVLTALSIFVIPEFESIFNDFDLILPKLTLWLLAVAKFLSHWGLLIIAALTVLFVIGLLNANRILPSKALGWFSDRIRLPFGRRTSIARFARFAADLLDAGVSIPDALRVAGFAVRQMRVQQAAWRLANDIETTGEFSQRAYQQSLTATIAFALAPNVPPATRIRLLRDVSECHAERVRLALSWTGGIIEPIAILAVGFAVGLAVIALFLPLVRLVDGLSG